MTMRLTNMEFRAYHGCLESERKEGNTFRVDFECEYDMTEAAVSDNLEAAVNYAEIYDIIKAEMSHPSNLLENVAYRIVQAIRNKFPQIESGAVTVSKYNPPVEGKCGSSSVTFRF